MRKIITIIFSITFLFAWSQKSIIKVIDANSREALPYVNICFESFDTEHKQYAVTNTKGEAQNPCSESAVVAISFIGYKTIIDTLKSGYDKTFKLEPDIFNLEQVVVTATRTKKALKDAPVITQVITSEDIGNRGITNVKDILAQDVTGLEMQRGGHGADVKMQGLEARNILILIDGERLAGENAYNVDYSRLNTDNVERVEIIKGAASALYGSQAMGGVINIITKTARKKLEVSASSKWAQYNQVNYPNLKSSDPNYDAKKNLDLPNLDFNTSVGFNLKGFSGRTDFSAKSYDAYRLSDKISITKEFINIDTTIVNSANPLAKDVFGYKDYSISQKLTIPITKGLKLDLGGSYYNHNEYNFDFRNIYQNFKDISYNGKISYTISDKYSIIASYHHDTYEKFDVKEKLDIEEKTYTNTFINPKLISSLRIGKYQNLTLGAEYFSDALFSGLFPEGSNQNKEVNTSVLFIQDDITFSKKWNIIAGGRIDIHEVFGTQFSPKLSAMYKLNKWSFRANYAKGFRSPSLKELYMKWQIAWFTIEGNENLKPETNDYISLSAEYTKDWLNTSVTVYKNWLINKIDGVWNSGQTIYKYQNASQVELSGIDFIAKVKIFRHFMLSGAYSFLQDKRPQGELVSQTSPHTGNVKISYRYTRNKYDLNLTLSANIIGAKNYTEIETIDFKGEEVEGEYLVHFDPYSIWQLAINQKFINGINMTIGIDNIFDYTADIVSFNTTTSPGRIAFISLKLDIDKLIKRK